MFKKKSKYILAGLSVFLLLGGGALYGSAQPLLSDPSTRLDVTRGSDGWWTGRGLMHAHSRAIMGSRYQTRVGGPGGLITNWVTVTITSPTQIVRSHAIITSSSTPTFTGNYEVSPPGSRVFRALPNRVANVR